MPSRIKMLTGCLSFLRAPTSLFVAAVVFLPLAFSGWPISLAAAKALPFMLAAMSAFATNDLVDVEKDRISKPHRALPSGAVSLRTARALTAAVLVLSCVASVACAASAPEFAIYAVTLLGAVLYNVVVKKAAEAKAFMTALISMMPFVFVSCLLQNPQGAWTIAVVLFFYISARELKMDIRDVEGDRRAGITTIAIRFGTSRCLMLSYGLLAASIAYYVASMGFYDPWALVDLALFLAMQTAIELAWNLGKAKAKRISILVQWIPMAIVFFSLI